MALLMALPQMAQTRRRSQHGNRTHTTTIQNGSAKGGKGTKGTKGRKSAKPNYTTSEIKGLQNQRQQIEQDIRNQQNRLRQNKESVATKLNELMVLNSEIDAKQRDIEGYENEIRNLDGNIGILNSQMVTLQEQLRDRQQKYVSTVRYMQSHHSIQEKLMFIFSANSLTQAYRRLRFMQEYAAYQRVQGEQIKAKQEEINVKNRQLHTVRSQKNQLLSKGKAARADLQNKHTEQQKVVSDLQNEQRTIQVIIADQERKNAQINAEIDRLVAVEVEKARQRAAAEAKRKAEAAAAKKRAEELARKKAEAEKARKEEERRIAAAKAEEARLKAAAEKARLEHERKRAAEKAAAEARQRAAAEEAKARSEKEARARREAEERARAAAEEARVAEEAARKAAADKERAEQAAREAESARLAAERKAQADAARREKEVEEEAKENSKVEMMSAVDRQISGSFESNRGRLPMPVTGKYKVVSHFGQYNVDGLKNVKLDNKGINILCEQGASARSIFEGEVSAVVNVAGQLVVMVRHGDFISVYCNLKSVHVRKGQKVATRQVLGAIGQDNILQFQLRREKSKLNPETWLGQ